MAEKEKTEKQVTNQEKPATITERMPEKIARKVREKLQLRQQRNNRFFQISMAIANAQIQQQKLIGEIKSAGDSANEGIKRAFKKLGLKNKKDYQWRFDGRDGFTGTLIKPKPEAPKK